MIISSINERRRKEKEERRRKKQNKTKHTHLPTPKNNTNNKKLQLSVHGMLWIDILIKILAIPKRKCCPAGLSGYPLLRNTRLNKHMRITGVYITRYITYKNLQHTNSSSNWLGRWTWCFEIVELMNLKTDMQEVHEVVPILLHT